MNIEEAIDTVRKGWPDNQLAQSKFDASEVIIAELTQLRADLARAEGERDEWRDAVLDAAVVSWVPSEGRTPCEIVNSLLAWESQVALDPAVSEPMAKLVQEGDEGKDCEQNESTVCPPCMG